MQLYNEKKNRYSKERELPKGLILRSKIMNATLTIFLKHIPYLSIRILGQFIAKNDQILFYYLVPVYLLMKPRFLPMIHRTHQSLCFFIHKYDLLSKAKEEGNAAFLL